MMQIDTDALLAPLSDEMPCGENLEYDPAFGELERIAQGTPERSMGDEVIAAEPPNWNDLLEKSLELFQRTKDLRVAVQLLHAGLRTQGLSAFTSGLTLMHRLVADYWDSVHPQLDKDDDDDPTLRMNTFLLLNDRAQVVNALSRCPLIQSKAFGRVSLRDIRIASGELSSSEEDSSLDRAQVDAAFLDGDLDELQANAAAAEAAVKELAALTSYLNEQVGASNAPDLTVLAAEVKALHGVLLEQLGRRGAGPVQEGDGSTQETAEAPKRAAAGEINSRDDVVRAIDRICDYFRKNEPSSPVPLLLQRAKGLVSKDFMDIIRDLTPDGVSQAKVIVGQSNEE